MADDYPIYPDLKGKVALILGVGQARTGRETENSWGNGAAIAWMFAQNGAKIFGCDIDLSAAEHTLSRIREAHENAVCDVLKADVTSAEDIQKTVEACMEKHGRIDVLVNNVGATASGDPVSLPEEVWDAQIDLNLKSIYLSLKAVLPIMERQGSGSVVNNASIAGLRFLGKPQVAYNAAKAAVIHLTKVTSCIYAPKGMRLNCIAPGLMYTPLVERLEHSDDPAERETFKKITQHNVPMGRMGTAWDVAAAAVFLASHKAAGYVTGQTLVVDGGLTSSTGTGA
ncbi:probable dehydrogenases with different specificities (related to short-chain alcohol dehydrogenases) [Cephalotrichum gorgonifer]|uniref:Probable dehydrogenases with different specificities (Related to short-chain alcohol dehydrogenases) n=1 Tax=Cephalotrichum gorgonifer TaxID=2041049 RepID=A0AAE8MSN5_9PEZI|nr:probable dehydrogenases with different specificities (related to short-chain alcohol dehydrogenases) [Cephalotrichum gorgonifer]